MNSLYKRNHITEDNNDLTVWGDGPTADCPMRARAVILDLVDDDGGSTQLSLNTADARFLRDMLSGALEALEAPEDTSKERAAA